VTFSDLAVPLDGGVLRPQGSLEFAPPELRVRVNAPIAAQFGSGEAPVWTTWHPRKFRVELNDEVLRYEAIDLPLAGELFPFRGSFDRATREINLNGDVPLRLVLDRDWGDPDLAQQLVDSDVPVFVILSGPVDAPRRSIDIDQALGMLSRSIDEAMGTVRGKLEQLVPRPTVEPAQPQPSERPPARAPDSPGGR
jgi:hypothetical protein